MIEDERSEWPQKVRQRYENYLKTLFYFQDRDLRLSFADALRKEGALLKGPFAEQSRKFVTGKSAKELAIEYFPNRSDDLLPALRSDELYSHQQEAINVAHAQSDNIVVATGTASGKTESFLYPILFELYRQFLNGTLSEPGVRALILYPMNALANDQRERLGRICRNLHEAGSAFVPTFGQYTGQTPENANDRRRSAQAKLEARLGPSELVLREEIRTNPPHILLTNYSMLEYLLLRPGDKSLFEHGLHWRFIVLDEAHQYRGAKGMEMGMLIRRLKQRLRDSGRSAGFSCIATSATITSREDDEERESIAEFAQELFGEGFKKTGVIFPTFHPAELSAPRRFHAFLRALEGAFLLHSDGVDKVVLNRKSDNTGAQPLEIALCRECGQHYYVGKVYDGKLVEAIRDPSHENFGVDYYLPRDDGDLSLCRKCGSMSNSHLDCHCNAEILVSKCESHKEHIDQIKRCESCGYLPGSIGDPVQEIVHGSDGPNAVIATALHELLPEDRRRVLAFADSRQEAAFFAWYVEDSYQKLRDRNLILRAVRASNAIGDEDLSIADLQTLLLNQYKELNLFNPAETNQTRQRRVLASILREAVTEERRLSLSGVGAISWTVALPESFQIPKSMTEPPWHFTNDEALRLIAFMLDELRRRKAIKVPQGANSPTWENLSEYPQMACCRGTVGRRNYVFDWCGPQSLMVSHFLGRILKNEGINKNYAKKAAIDLMTIIWEEIRKIHDEPILVRAPKDGTFRLNPNWLRVNVADVSKLWECRTCASLTSHNIRGICPRYKCPGTLRLADKDSLNDNHYRILYESKSLPVTLTAEEHTAQIDGEIARERQEHFKNGNVNLLSSSTTFEVGVDLGDLDVVFLRNVPPESFNYIQRVGRAGRRGTHTGLAITYCRRNPHDLYHFERPIERVLNGIVRPPRLQLTNTKIILRHMVAVAIAAFFRKHENRFNNVQSFIGSWERPSATSSLREFCIRELSIAQTLRAVVPIEMHAAVGLNTDTWLDKISGQGSRLSLVEAEVSADIRELQALTEMYIQQRQFDLAKRIADREDTIATESVLNFLSRKAVIPKYGFPVDVVELDTHPMRSEDSGISLQRDLSQAISEYAPGSKIVANKLEYESYGVKSIPGKEWKTSFYQYDKQHRFSRWVENSLEGLNRGDRKYLIPEFGFVTPFQKKPSEPRGRVRRLYTTRPFFQGFGSNVSPEIKHIKGVHITKAQSGTLVILCEGKKREGFRICRTCGAQMNDSKNKHKTPFGNMCNGKLDRFSLAHELETDVIRLEFPGPIGQWEAYSIGYAVLLGASEILHVPHTDLNVTITKGTSLNNMGVVLYDNVPGGAGLVVQLEQETVFSEMIECSHQRVSGVCGCNASCYGCLRSYRNQFAHPYLSRQEAKRIFDLVLNFDTIHSTVE